MTPAPKIKVLIVDDSAVVRRAVSDALAHDPGIEVVGTALDPIIARDKILRLQPDVLTLDIEMPRMDGITFLKEIMREAPLPVIILSSLTTHASATALDALQAGAVDVVAKPGSAFQIGDVAAVLPEKVRAAYASRGRLRKRTYPAPSAMTAPVPVSPAVPAAPRAQSVAAAVPAPRAASVHRVPAAPPARLAPIGGTVFATRQLIVLGASTGGTEALKELLIRLPDGLPPIAIVQHIPAYFSKAFADRLDTLCAFDVHEAVDGERLRNGQAVIAPGGWHMALRWSGDHYAVQLRQGPAVWHQRPAVDVLFHSAAACAGRAAVAGILTGMGRDGAEGMLKLKEAGARTFAQDEESCVVFGMPRVAIELGAAEQVVSLEDMPRVLLQLVDAVRRRAPAAASASGG